MAGNIPQDKEKKPDRQPVRAESKLLEYPHHFAAKGDILKLVIVVALIAGSVFFYNMRSLPSLLRVSFLVAGIALGLFILFYWCGFGRRFIDYVIDSVTEFKKIVWPVRQDAVRMTFFVLIFVAILSLFIYVSDSLISWLFFDFLLRRG